jgi:hypothetical protein
MWDKDVLFAQLAEHDNGMALGILLALCNDKYVRIVSGQFQYKWFRWEEMEVEVT